MLCTVGRFDGDMFVIGVSSKLLQRVFSIMRAIRCASSKSKTCTMVGFIEKLS